MQEVVPDPCTYDTTHLLTLLYTVRRPDNYELIAFTSRGKLHGQWGPRLRRSVPRGWLGLPWYSSWLLSGLDAEVGIA
jgi:hypothetical protein